MQVDSQLDDISTSTTELRDAIIDVRRSDGALQNGIVTLDSLEDGLIDVLTGMSEADAAAASALAAAASAAEADADAQALLVSSAALTAAANAFATGGVYVDWGNFHTAPGASLDWGSFH